MSDARGIGQTDPAEFVKAMGPVARELLGEPTEHNKAKRELRFGTRGSLCVSLDKGTWFDNEANRGGGVLAFVQERKNLKKAAAITWLQDHGHIPKAAPSKPTGRRIVATYDYTDADGVLRFQVVRFDPKDFRQRAPDGKGGWAWSMGGVERVLYRLPEVIAAVSKGRTIFIAEGEKGVHALESIGLVGTCSPGGAGKWGKVSSAPLAGADIVVLSDADEPGQDHAADVAKRLCGIANTVRVVLLPGLPPKGDVADWIAAGGTREDLERIVLDQPPVDGLDPAPAFSEADEPPPSIDDPGYHAALTASFQPDPVAALMAEFNARYMVVNESGKAIIYEPAHDVALDRRHHERISFDDFRRLYLNRRIRVGQDDKAKPIIKPVADVWLHHPDRRQYIGGVVFDPSGRHARADALNLWQGFAVQPRPGSWARLQDHMLTVICAGNRDHFDWLVGWMARLVQRPAEQGEVAVVMRGIEGTGKGTLAKALLRILGQHGLAISNGKHLTGTFNGHLRDTVLLFADEAFFAGDRAHVGVLKSLITEPTLAIEAKFQNAVQMPNFVHLMMASNEDWVVPASLEARRFFVLEVSPRRANDHAYFAAIWAEMDQGGYQAMLHDLLDYDLTFFNHRAAPKTAGLQEQKKLSLPAAEDWWLETLHRGYVHKSRHGLEAYFSQWHDHMATEILFDAYTAHAKARGDRHPMGREAFGRFMVRMGAKSIRPRNVVTGEHVTDTENPYGGTTRKAQLVRVDRANAYSLGDLSTARAAFATATTLQIDWPESQAPDV